MMTIQRENCIHGMISAIYMQFYPDMDGKDFYEDYEDHLFDLIDKLPPEWFNYFADVLNLMQPGA